MIFIFGSVLVQLLFKLYIMITNIYGGSAWESNPYLGMYVVDF
jgi:hypothetical protein